MLTRTRSLAFALTALAACDDAPPAPVPSALAITLDLDAMRGKGLVAFAVSVDTERWLSEPVEHGELADLVGASHTIDVPCAAGETLEVFVTASTDGVSSCSTEGMFQARATVTCRAGETVALTIDTFERFQGRFDCWPETDNLCSAKVDVSDLLHGDDGERQPTLIVASSCVLEPGTQAAMFVSDLRVTCDDRSVSFALTRLPGERFEPGWPFSLGVIHREERELASAMTLNSYWLLDPAALGADTCHITQTFAVAATPANVLRVGQAPNSAYRLEAIVVEDGALSIQATKPVLTELDPTSLRLPLTRVPVDESAPSR